MNLGSEDQADEGTLTDYLELCPEAPQQLFADSRLDRLLRKATQGMDGLLHLFEVDPAAKAHAQVQVKSDTTPERQRPLEIVRHHLDRFLTGQPARQIVKHVGFDVVTIHAGRNAPRPWNPLTSPYFRVSGLR